MNGTKCEALRLRLCCGCAGGYEKSVMLEDGIDAILMLMRDARLRYGGQLMMEFILHAIPRFLRADRERVELDAAKPGRRHSGFTASIGSLGANAHFRSPCLLGTSSGDCAFNHSFAVAASAKLRISSEAM
jgi:hypothetical protein